MNFVRSIPALGPLNIVSTLSRRLPRPLDRSITLGIVHRDIKPSNILLLRGTAGEVRVKVLDFGISKVSNGAFAGMTSVLTQQSLIIGTPEYMSPEQASGRLENAIDGRADLYSLGLVLYEMLTGAHPFQADTPMGMLIQQINTQPPPPESIRAVSPAVSALVLKCLAKDPANRFQSAAELLAALHNLQGGMQARSPTLQVANTSGAAHLVSERRVEAPQRYSQQLLWRRHQNQSFRRASRLSP